MKCPRCGKEEAIVDSRFGVLPGKKCQQSDENHRVGKKPEFYTISQHNRVTKQRDQHGKDILQPYGPGLKPNPDFVKAYPDKVENYFTKEQLKKL